jgi:hypothetical protein
MNGFTIGTYEIRYEGQPSKLSGLYKTEAGLLDAIRPASPGRYEVSLMLGVNDFEEWGKVIHHGDGKLTVYRRSTAA